MAKSSHISPWERLDRLVAGVHGGPYTPDIYRAIKNEIQSVLEDLYAMGRIPHPAKEYVSRQMFDPARKELFVQTKHISQKWPPLPTFVQ